MRGKNLRKCVREIIIAVRKFLITSKCIDILEINVTRSPRSSEVSNPRVISLRRKVLSDVRMAAGPREIP